MTKKNNQKNQWQFWRLCTYLSVHLYMYLMEPKDLLYVFQDTLTNLFFNQNESLLKKQSNKELKKKYLKMHCSDENYSKTKKQQKKKSLKKCTRVMLQKKKNYFCKCHCGVEYFSII